MERRVILAFVLSFAVLYAFRSLYSPAPPPPEPAPAEQSTPAVPANKSSPPPVPNPPANPPAQKTEAPAPAPEDLHAAKSEDFVMETPLYIATFSNVGVLRSCKL